MRKEKLKLSGMDRIIMSMDPSHKWNEITESIEDPLEVWQRAIGQSIKTAMDKNSGVQKAPFGRTIDLIWLTQGIIEDLVIHLTRDNPKEFDRWTKAINGAQEYLLHFKDPQRPQKLKAIWSSKVIKLHNSFVEEDICKDLGVKTLKEAKKVLDRDYEIKVINGVQTVVKKEEK